MALTYLDFELEIGLDVDGVYPVAVIKSPAGETRTTLRWPFSELQLENRLKDLQIALLSSGGVRRQVLSLAEQAVQTFGRELFEWLFTGETRILYAESLASARQQGKSPCNMPSPTAPPSNSPKPSTKAWPTACRSMAQ